MKLASQRLQAFHEIAKAGSFSKAAQALHVTQSALSHRIAKLEEELKTTLFLRDVSGLKLTEPGEALLRHCQVYEGLETELDQILCRNTEGTNFMGAVRIGGTSTLMRSVVMPSLKDLIGENPCLRVETYVRELSELPKLLGSGAVDYVVSCSPIQKDDLESHMIGHERNVMIAPKSPGKREHIFLDHDPDDRTTLEFLKVRGKPVTKIERSYLDDIDGILEGVALGWGWAVVPEHLTQGRKSVKVVKSYGVWKKPVYVQHFRQPYYSRLHTAVLQALTANAPALLEA